MLLKYVLYIIRAARRPSGVSDHLISDQPELNPGQWTSEIVFNESISSADTTNKNVLSPSLNKNILDITR